MGKANDLKVYNDVELLAGWVLDLSGNFPKQYRYLAQRLVNVTFDCMDDITLANLREGTERAMFLDAFVVHFTSLKTILRICTRKRIVSVGNEAFFLRSSANIGRQIAGWKRATLNQIVKAVMAVYNLIFNGCPTGRILPVTNKIQGMITEYNSNNAWIVNGASGQVNGNNNKANSYVVRGVAALGKLYSILFESFVEAYHDCICNKMSSSQCCEFRADYEDRLYNLYLQVVSGTYEPLKSLCFVVIWPLYREVFAADFQDRIIHHWICIRLEPLFDKRFAGMGDVSHNCRKGFGTESAVQALFKDIYDCSNGFTKSCWVGRYDISGFFMSIDKGIAWVLLSELINEHYHEADKECLLYLVRITVFHLPQEHCIKRSPESLWDKIPDNKSLFGNDPYKGMPIGNLPSQLIANFYMSFFDEFVLSLGFKYYERYADDFALVHKDKDFILKAIPLFESFLWNKLKLKLHPQKRYLQHYTKGIMFVGAVIKMDRIYVGKRIVRNTRRTIMHINKELEEGKELTDSMISSLNSYYGFMRKRKAYAIRRGLTKNFSPLLWDRVYMTNHFLRLK